MADSTGPRPGAAQPRWDEIARAVVETFDRERRGLYKSDVVALAIALERAERAGLIRRATVAVEGQAPGERQQVKSAQSPIRPPAPTRDAELGVEPGKSPLAAAPEPPQVERRKEWQPSYSRLLLEQAQGVIRDLLNARDDKRAKRAATEKARKVLANITGALTPPPLQTPEQAEREKEMHKRGTNLG